MRGKEGGADPGRTEPGITPAYAGKSSRQPGAGRWRRDHPRVCGEKDEAHSCAVGKEGSPPRMRGKALAKYRRRNLIRITPAYAGKSLGQRGKVLCMGDHPRVCGEKHLSASKTSSRQGSPPRMRGKDDQQKRKEKYGGITPAYAGKSLRCCLLVFLVRDHPRVCGEKVFTSCYMRWLWGSPPRMRGKADILHGFQRPVGITPAYAGKSLSCLINPPPAQDHPRVCGEKSRPQESLWREQGSPPRMRGKANELDDMRALPWITPAYAGKSRPS